MRVTRRPLFGQLSVGLSHTKCRHSEEKGTIRTVRYGLWCAFPTQSKLFLHERDSQVISSQVTFLLSPILEPNGRRGRSVTVTLPHQLETILPASLLNPFTKVHDNLQNHRYQFQNHACPCHACGRLGNPTVQNRGTETTTPLLTAGQGRYSACIAV